MWYVCVMACWGCPPGMQQMAGLQASREARNLDEEEAYRVKKKTFDLLPNAEENIAKLQVGPTAVFAA